MGAKRAKRIPLRAVTLPGLTLAALVIACDTEAPTAIDDALLDALANAEAEASADGTGRTISDIVRDHLADGAPAAPFRRSR